MAKRWYVVHTYSGYENKVKTDLEHRIEIYGLEDKVVDIQIPTEQVTELKDGGKRETKENKVFPSYVLVRMEMDDNTWAVVRNTPGVTGFVGLDGKPSPLRRDEFEKMMRRGGNRAAAAAAAPKEPVVEGIQRCAGGEGHCGHHARKGEGKEFFPFHGRILLFLGCF